MDSKDDDFLWGVEPIAHEIARDVRATYHLLASGEIPAKKVGGRWVASRMKLRAFLRGEAA